MCRMILALGRIDAHAVFRAAQAMSQGQTASCDAPIRLHPDGWGAVYRRRGQRHLGVYRSTEPVFAASAVSFLSMELDLLVVHARHATRSETRGLEFTHPITIVNAEADWHLLHNGFLPSVYRALGEPRSTFDSLEYLRYILPPSGFQLDAADVLGKLNALEPEGTSANAVVLSQYHVYILHYTFPTAMARQYFTMHRLQEGRALYVASDPIPQLAPLPRWEPLPPRSLIELPLPPSGMAVGGDGPGAAGRGLSSFMDPSQEPLS